MADAACRESRTGGALVLALALYRPDAGNALDEPAIAALHVRLDAADIFARLRFTEDHREAEATFAEKREPAFHGR